jgi:hypothetical protein
MNVQFKQRNFAVSFSRYRANNNIGILLDGPEEVVASVNVPEDLDIDEVAIKNYSELDGMLDALLEAKVIEIPHRYVTLGYVNHPICKLSPEALDILADQV